MLIAQLARFLVEHHHPGAARAIFGSVRAFSRWYAWARAHGFTYQP